MARLQTFLRHTTSWRVLVQVMSAAEQAGFDTLDIEPAFKASGYTPAELQADNEHPNPLGHEIAAGAIFERIAKDHERLFGVQ